jgi:signal peptidase II
MAKQTAPKGDPSHAAHAATASSRFSTKGLALCSFRAHLFIWLTAALGLFADLYTKQWAAETLGPPNQSAERIQTEQKTIVLVMLQYHTNPGAVWGIGAGKTTLLVATSVAALGFLFWLFATSRSDQKMGHIALGMLFAGAVGNLYNRIFNDGKVIDFIVVDLHFWPANPWPTFNIADALLCIGVGLLLISFYRAHKHTAASSREPAQPKS